MTMSEEIIVAVLAMVGTIIGSLIGAYRVQHLTDYRVNKIEERLNQMDTLDKRMDNLELKQAMTDTVIESIRNEIDRNIKDIRELKNNDRT